MSTTDTYKLRKKLIHIARKDVGQKEKSRNQGHAMKKFWPATDYPDGYFNREPYCAAAMCYWVREWLRDPEVQAATGKTASKLESWRCKSAAAFGWTKWAYKNGLLVMDDSMSNTLHTGDIMVFDMSHIGLVVDDAGEWVYTIEANTGPSGGNDGDGIWEKKRHRSVARNFIRIMD